MTNTINDANQIEHPESSGAERVEAGLLLAAAERIVPQGGNRRDLAARFLAGARSSGLDLSHTYAVFERTTGGREPLARQACFAIPGPGRTAMLLASPPRTTRPETRSDQDERDACVRNAIGSLADSDVRIAQALPDPSETWACSAYERAGMRLVGELAYLSRPLPGARVTPGALPPGVSIRPVDSLSPGSSGRRALTDLLARTYEGTLDCPELCGLRDADDILESHLAAGVFDPRHWLMAHEGGREIGCCLVSETADGATAELVYVGLVPEARVRRLARRLLETSISGLGSCRAQRLVCAVDRRNHPATRVYNALGFREFASRRALVHPIGPGAR